MDVLQTPNPAITGLASAAPSSMPQIAQDAAASAIGPVLDVLVQLLPLIIVLLIGRIIMGILCKRMAAKKGYTKYFWTGFFLGTLGFIYVIFLPDLRMQKYVAMCASKLQGIEASVSAMEKAMYPQQPAGVQQPYNNGYNNYGY